MRASPVSARRGAPCFFRCVKGGTRFASKPLPPSEGLSRPFGRRGRRFPARLKV